MMKKILTMFLLAFLVFSVFGQSVMADANDESRLNYILVEEQLSHELLDERQQALVDQLDNTGADVEQILTLLYNIELALENSESNIDALIAEAQSLGLTDLVTSFTEVKVANQDLEEEIDTLLDVIDNDRDAKQVTTDNCPTTANANQVDVDGDGIGDACDTNNTDGPLADVDGDGILNGADTNNTDGPLADVDGDGILNGADTNNTDGPLADTDSDGDANGVDNCPTIANADQADTDNDHIGNVCDTTPNGATLTYQQKYEALKTDFNDYEDDYDEDLEDNYNDAVKKDDESDIEDAEDDLKKLKDDLKELRDQAKDLENEVEDANDDEEYDNLLDDIGELIDDITDFRDDVSALLSGETTDTTQNNFDYVSDYTPPRTTPTASAPTGKVVLEPLEVPNLVLAGQDQTTTGTQWESIRNMVFIAGGVVILLAIILFLIALLVR